MTPNFALNLSEDGIDLLHRDPAGAGWVKVGYVALDGGNLRRGLRSLRKTAEEIEGKGFATKLILPPSQLLYATIDVGDDPKADVEAALEDRTPYHISDIVYDMHGTGGTRQVVAVARETLTEAEAFLAPYSFNPRGFTAIPEPGHFDGEPFLGPFRKAPGFKPDAQAIKVIDAYSPAPETEPEQKAEEAPDAQKPEVTQSAAKTEPPAPKAPPAEKLASEPPKQDPEPTASRPLSEPAASKPTKKATVEDVVNAAAETPSGTQTRSPSSDDAPRRRLSRLTPVAPGPQATPPAPKPEPTRNARALHLMGATKAEPTPKPDVVAKTATPPRPSVPPAPVNEVPRAAPYGSVDPIAKLEARRAEDAGPKRSALLISAGLVVGVGLVGLLASTFMPESSLGRLFGGEAPRDVVETSTPAAPVSVNESEFASVPTANPGLAPVQEAAPQQDSVIAPAPVPVPAPQVAASEADAAPVAPLQEQASSNYSQTGIWDQTPTRADQVALGPLEDFAVASLDSEVGFEDPASLSPRPDSADDPQLGSQDTPPPPGLRFEFDERGLVIATPEGAVTPQGTIVFSEAEIKPTQRPGTVAIVDEAEVAAQEGAGESAEEAAARIDGEITLLTPDLPPGTANIRPRARPSNISASSVNEPATSEADTVIEDASAPSEPEIILQDENRAALARFRPQQRNATRVAQIVQERAALAEAEANAAAAEQTARSDAIAEAVAQAEREAAEAADAPSALAVLRSRVPAARPENLQQVAARYRPAAQQAPAAEQSASASTAAIQQASGPAVVRRSRATPTGPTTQAVARAATDNNAIALGRVSLVGVFGTANNRRALVRLPNGRFQKVSVGDRVDGGRIAAIGESALSYTRGGRTFTLEMP